MQDSDLQIIARDLLSGRLYRAGSKMYGGAWCHLLLGDKFSSTASSKQIHELVYTRTNCTCIPCLIKYKREAADDSEEMFQNSSDITARSQFIPEHSAMANFVQHMLLPSVNDLKRISSESERRELDMGTVVRLNNRNAAKFKFTSDFKQLFCHLAYTGPISHEEVFRRVTTNAVNYYENNKGKKERKVYLRGTLYKIPLELGIVKLGTRPLRTDELGCHYLLYRKQVLQIYDGEIVLEGNMIGS